MNYSNALDANDLQQLMGHVSDVMKVRVIFYFAFVFDKFWFWTWWCRHFLLTNWTSTSLSIVYRIHAAASYSTICWWRSWWNYFIITFIDVQFRVRFRIFCGQCSQR